MSDVLGGASQDGVDPVPGLVPQATMWKKRGYSDVNELLMTS
jgi:hypothetical protein